MSSGSVRNVSAAQPSLVQEETTVPCVGLLYETRSLSRLGCLLLRCVVESPTVWAVVHDGGAGCLLSFSDCHCWICYRWQRCWMFTYDRQLSSIFSIPFSMLESKFASLCVCVTLDCLPVCNVSLHKCIHLFLLEMPVSLASFSLFWLDLEIRLL